MNTMLPLVVKAVIAGLTAFWLYRDSRARDFNWIMWVFMPGTAFLAPDIPFALGVIVIVLAVYLGSRPKGSLFKCPHCNKGIHHELFVCPFCHKNAKKECLRCHEPVDWNAEQCSQCNSRAITEG